MEAIARNILGPLAITTVANNLQILHAQLNQIGDDKLFS